MNVNLEILNDYSSTDGKTRAFYGLIELKYLYKYYFLIISLLPTVFLFFAFKNGELKPLKHTATFILLVGVLSIFIDFWKWFV